MRLTPEQLNDLRSRAIPEVGNKLALAIEIAETTQSAVVEATGYRAAYVSDVARGRYPAITVPNASKFAEFFGCAIEDLFPPTRREAMTA